MGGPAYLQIREVGKEGSEKWVTKGHVQALSFGKRQCLAEELGAREGSSSADRSGAGEGGSGDQLEEEGGEEEITREALRTAVMGVAAAAEPPCPRSLALRLVRGRRRAMAMASWPPRSSPGWGAVVRRSASGYTVVGVHRLPAPSRAAPPRLVVFGILPYHSLLILHHALGKSNQW